jgi:hypothetical protein
MSHLILACCREYIRDPSRVASYWSWRLAFRGPESQEERKGNQATTVRLHCHHLQQLFVVVTVRPECDRAGLVEVKWENNRVVNMFGSGVRLADL